MYLYVGDMAKSIYNVLSLWGITLVNPMTRGHKRQTCRVEVALHDERRVPVGTVGTIHEFQDMLSLRCATTQKVSSYLRKSDVFVYMECGKWKRVDEARSRR